MGDHTFYVLAAYSVAALAIGLEIFLALRHRRIAQRRAQTEPQNIGKS